MDLLTAIRERRSLPPKLMNGHDIPTGDLNRILEAATWAPSHRQTEPWRFIVHQAAGRAHLASILCDAYRASAKPVQTAKIEKLNRRATLCGAVIALILSPPDPPKNPVEEEVMAFACAVQNLHLAAHAYGIGGYWTTPKFMDYAIVRRELGLAHHERCMGIFYLGYPAQSWPSSKRRPLEEKVRYVTQASH